MHLLNRFKDIGNSLSQIDILDIDDGILHLSSDRYRLILETSSLNFELKSEAEQDVIIDGYQNFLNALNFDIQILIRVRQLDIDQYLHKIDELKKTEIAPIYKKQLLSYKKFISKLVTDNKILSRRFYVIIPCEGPNNKKLEIKQQLQLRSEIVVRNLLRLGISAKSLNSLEIIDLFYSFYNPNSAKLQPILASEESVILTTNSREG